MVSTVQTYQLNNRQVEVDLTQVPELSTNSRNILSGLVPLPPSFKTTTSLEGRIEKMEITATKLQEAKEHGTTRKVIAFLVTALVACLIAGLILFIIANPIAVILILFIFLSIALGVSIVAILGDLFTEKSRLTKFLNEQQESISNTLSQYKDQNDQILPIAYSFYREKTEQTVRKLDARIHQIEEQDLSHLPAECSSAATSHVAALAHARNELTQMAQFYRQFDPIPICTS